MYIALVNNCSKVRYIIRESVAGSGGESFVSRDLVDLGTDPTEFVRYIGRNSFYLDPDLEEIVRQRTLLSDETDLEELFWPFLAPEVQQQAEFVSHRYRGFTPKKLVAEEIAYLQGRVHLFDKKRLHYLRYGSLSQASLYKAPLKMFLPLLYKSRDELEQFFLVQEGVLEPNEFRQYVYVIFDLQRFFSETAARVLPEGLDQDRLAEIFEPEFCKLFADRSFATGLDERTLIAYLSRYVVMFFDYEFPSGSFAEDYARQFRDEHRTFNFPQREVVFGVQEADELFGVSKEGLEKMSKKQLTALYRQRAHAHHPDKGGDHDVFVRLTELYRQLRKSKK
jgi:hypothetical protein